MEQKKRIGLFGFGQTGRVVAQEIANSSDFELTWVVRKSAEALHRPSSLYLGYLGEFGTIYQADELNPDFFARHPVDIIVDFSHQEALREYAAAAGMGVRIVSAISHYDQAQIEELGRLARATAVLHSPNITLGVNCLIIASQVLQKIMPHADIEVVEEHFKAKRGVSGTARKIASVLRLDESSQVNSIRVGGIVGRHEVVFGLPNQTIRINHESISRAAFGQGALFAARWIMGKGNGLYSMEQVISQMFRENVPAY